MINTGNEEEEEDGRRRRINRKENRATFNVARRQNEKTENNPSKKTGSPIDQKPNWLANGQQIDSKEVAQRVAQQVAPPPNSNSISILSSKNTNTPLEETENPVSKGQLNIFDLPDDWQEIDLTNIENNSLINLGLLN